MRKELLEVLPRVMCELLGSDVLNERKTPKLFAKHPVRLSLLEGLFASQFMSDMERHLLVNESDEDFVSSDRPVVLYNKYCETPDADARALLRKGLLVLFPLSPKLLLVLYDPATYKLKASLDRRSVVRRSSDALQYNRLQWANATDIVLLPPGYTNEQVHRYFADAKRDRKEVRWAVAESIDASAQLSGPAVDTRRHDLMRKARRVLMSGRQFPNITLETKHITMRHSAIRGGKRMDQRLRETRESCLDADELDFASLVQQYLDVFSLA